MAPGCTDPNLNTTFAADENAGVDRAAARHVPLPVAQGLRRVLRLRAHRRLQGRRSGGAGLDPAAGRHHLARMVRAARPGAVLVRRQRLRQRAHRLHLPRRSRARRPAQQRRRASSGGDFAAVPSTLLQRHAPCTTAPSTGLLANVSTATLQALFPPGNPASFTGNENGGAAQTSNGRPNTLPYAFTVRVVVKSASGAPGPAMTGEDRRQAFLHRDQDMLNGFPHRDARRRRREPGARRPRRQRHQPADRRQLRRLDPRLPVRRLGRAN